VSEYQPWIELGLTEAEYWKMRYLEQRKIKREHIESPDCWCEPELIADHTNEGGTKAYLHREEQ